MNKDIIIDKLRQHKEFAESRGAISVGVFGSYSKNEQNDDSDIDILIELKREAKSFDNFMYISQYLEELLGKNVDLVTTDSISSEFFAQIEKDLIYV